MKAAGANNQRTTTSDCLDLNNELQAAVMQLYLADDLHADLLEKLAHPGKNQSRVRDEDNLFRLTLEKWLVKHAAVDRKIFSEERSKFKVASFCRLFAI